MRSHGRSVMLSGVAGMVGMALAATATDLVPPPEAASSGNVAIRIAEYTTCSREGVKLRVEIANGTDAPHRLQVCANLQLSCIVDSFVFVQAAGTGYGLRDPGCNAEPRRADVHLVSGATYTYPVTLGFDRFPEDCLKADGPLGIRVSLLVNDAWVYSDEIEIALPERDG